MSATINDTITDVTTEALSTVAADITSSVVTDITSNAAEATTHIYDTYNYFVHPHWYDFPLVSDEWHYIVGVYITIVGFTGVFGNGLVIYIFSSVKNLRTSSNMFLVNLAISDMTFCIVNGFPLMSLSAFNKRWIFGNAACEFYGLIGGIFGLMSINTMAAIAIDRYYAIARPLHVAKFMTRKRAFFMIVGVWLWSLLWSVPPVFGWGAYIPEGFQVSCTFDYLTQTDNNRSFVMCLYLCGFVVPLLIILVCYAFIIKAVRDHEIEMKKTAKKLNAEMRTNQDKTRMEIRVTKISFIIVLLYLLSWSPYAVVALIGQFGDAKFVTPFWSELPVMLAKASAMHDPIVYSLSHPKFRAALYERLPWLLCCCKPDAKLSSGDTTRKSRNNSGFTRGSSQSSVVSNISDSQHADIELRLRELEDKTGLGERRKYEGGTAKASNEDIPAGKIIQDLVQALVGVATSDRAVGHSVRPVYIPSTTLQKKADDSESTTVSEDQVFVLDNSTLPSLARYLVKFSNLNSEQGGSNPANEPKTEIAQNQEIAGGSQTDNAKSDGEARF